MLVKGATAVSNAYDNVTHVQGRFAGFRATVQSICFGGGILYDMSKYVIT